MSRTWINGLFVYLTTTRGSALTPIFQLRREDIERKRTDAPEALGSICTLESGAPEDGGTRLSRPSPNTDEILAERNEPRERRKTRRFPVSIFAKVTRLDGKKGTFECEIADISQGGMCLCLPEFIPSGTLVGVEFLHKRYFGTVCQAQEVGGLFITGIQFEEPIDYADVSQILHAADSEA